MCTYVHTHTVSAIVLAVDGGRVEGSEAPVPYPLLLPQSPDIPLTHEGELSQTESGGQMPWPDVAEQS